MTAPFGPRMQDTSSTLKKWARWAANSWATRSLAVGALATVLDLATVGVTYQLLEAATWVATSVGALLGAIFTFFVNRHFAFRDHRPQLAPQAIKFVMTTAASVAIHAGVVWLLSVRHGMNIYVAKLISDVAVFSVGQLFVLRYVVFPKAKPEELTALEASPVVEPTLRAG